MQKSILRKVVWKVILVLVLATCFYFLSKTGVQPLWAAIGIIFIKSVIRFIFRISVILVSIAIVIAIIIFLICI